MEPFLHGLLQLLELSLGGKLGGGGLARPSYPRVRTPAAWEQQLVVTLHIASNMLLIWDLLQKRQTNPYSLICCWLTNDQLTQSPGILITHLWFDCNLRMSRTLSLVFLLITHENSLWVKSIFRDIREQTVLLANRTQGSNGAHPQCCYRKLRLFLWCPLFHL